MTGLRNRFAALQASAFAIAALSQLQGTVSGPLTILAAQAPSVTGRTAGDYPNPIGPHFSVTLRGFVFSSPLALLEAPLAPMGRGAIDPNPAIAPFPIGLRTITQALIHSTLANQGDSPETCSFGDTHAASFPVSLRTWTQNLLATTLGTPPVIPPQSGYWPNPLRPRHPIDHLTWAQNLSQTTLKPAETFIFRAPLVTRWEAKPYPVECRTWTQNLLASTLAPAPVATYIFRTPQITRWATKPYPVALRTWIPPNIRLNLIEDDVPLSCGWGNPPTGAPYPATLRSITQNLISNTLSAPPSFPDGRHAGDHQPNPRGYAHPAVLHTIAHGPIPPTAPAVQRFVPIDFPNPRGYAYPVSLRTGLPSRNLTLIAGDDEFFGVGGPTYDWPNPRGYVYPVSLRTWIPRPFQPGFLAPTPIVPIDWPNPRGYEYPVALRSLTLNLQESTLAGQGVTISGGIDIELTVCREKTVELTVTRTLSITLKV